MRILWTLSLGNKASAFSGTPWGKALRKKNCPWERFFLPPRMPFVFSVLHVSRPWGDFFEICCFASHLGRMAQLFCLASFYSYGSGQVDRGELYGNIDSREVGKNAFEAPFAGVSDHFPPHAFGHAQGAQGAPFEPTFKPTNTRLASPARGQDRLVQPFLTCPLLSVFLFFLGRTGLVCK